EVKTLERQKKEMLKAIKERYGMLLGRDRQSEAVLKRERTLLKEQQAALIALATTDAQREAIRSRFQLLFRVLTGEIQMDDQLITQLQAEGQAMARQVNALFQARIDQLNADMRATPGSGSKNGSKSPKVGGPVPSKSGK